jgi:hypothetical protein
MVGDSSMIQFLVKKNVAYKDVWRFSAGKPESKDSTKDQEMLKKELSRLVEFIEKTKKEADKIKPARQQEREKSGQFLNPAARYDMLRRYSQ